MTAAPRPSLVSAGARLALEAAPYLVLALYLAAETGVAVLVIGRPVLLVTAAPVALVGIAALARRRAAAARARVPSGPPRRAEEPR